MFWNPQKIAFPEIWPDLNVVKISSALAVGEAIEILVLERVCLSCSCKHFGRKNPGEKSADLHPRQSNFTTLEHFYRAQQNLSSLHKKGWRPTEKKFDHFFQNMCSRSRFLWVKL
jgi:hypothetical protein